MFKCDYCEKTFSSKGNLNRHVRSAKGCLTNREREKDIGGLCCKYCNKSFYRKDNVVRHEKNCKFQEVELLEKNENMMNIVALLFKQYGDLVKDLANGGSPKPKENKKQVINNLQPITEQDLLKHIANFSLDYVREGARGYASFAGEYPFKDKIICTDRSRKKIQYKNEDGTINTDGRLLAQRFFQAIAERNTALLNKEYSELRSQLEDIVSKGTAGEQDVSEILRQSSFIQEMLIKTQNAAQGKDEEFIQEFLHHLSKRVM